MLQLLSDSIVSLIGNAVLFGAIPVIWWAVFHRKKESLTKFVGLYKPERKAAWWILAVFAVIYILNYNYGEDIMELFMSEHSLQQLYDGGGGQDSALLGIGLIGILPALITNYIGNGFFEELLYRGFLLKRFKKLTNNAVAATIITSVLFGLMHNLLYLVADMSVGIDYHIGIFLYTTVGALLLGFANEKLFNGSIWPSILLHGTGNFITSVLVIFSLH